MNQKPHPQRCAPSALGVVLATAMCGFATQAQALDLNEAPKLAERVAAGTLPPVDERVPSPPRVVKVAEPGKYGGDMRIIMGRNQDTRLMVVYGYARLVSYTTDLELVPDILESFEIEDERIFTFKLRKGHKWSDGSPFTTEDFRYWWDDVANNGDLYPFGPPTFLLIDGVPPTVEIIDELTVRLSWLTPNPFFLPRLAAPRPEFIYLPSNYLKKVHVDYADPAALAARMKASRRRNWAALHNSLDNLYNSDNPELPVLQPWSNTGRPPSQRYAFVRNPYFHRVDSFGNQLPYIDRVLMSIADGKLIPAKTGAGEADLQARSLFMAHYTFLREAEAREDFRTLLWRTAKGADMALYPNLNHYDPEWRALFRDVRFRRALSVAIDRDEINQVIFLGLATPANNTALPDSPLFKADYQSRWTQFDPDLANQLLDEIGLTERDSDGVRLLPDGRLLELVVETAGEETQQTDMLELVRDTWLAAGIKLYTRLAQREVFRSRIYAGETQLAVWSGMDNGIPTADFSPEELAPVQQIQLQWPKWGQYTETGGQVGEPVDMAEVQELLDLNDQWRTAAGTAERERIWHRMLDIHADQLYSIGIVCCTRQPVVVSNRLHGVPDEGIYSWDPGAYFGIYLPDTFWLN